MTAFVRTVGSDNFVPIGSSTTTLSVALASHVPDDHLYVFVYVYATFTDTDSATDPWTTPDGWTLVSESAMEESSTVVGRFAVFAIEAESNLGGTLEITNPLHSDFGQMLAQSISVGGAGGQPGLQFATSGTINAADPAVPAVAGVVDDSLGVLVQHRVGTPDWGGSGGAGGGELGPSPWENLDASSWGLRHGGTINLYEAVFDSDVPATPTGWHIGETASGTGTAWYIVYTLVVPPAPTPTPPPGLADYSRLALDCADDYKVFITGPDFDTIVGRIGWSDIEWSRIEDEISTATIIAPDKLGGVYCVAEAGGLLPWRYGIRIDRNDQSVWKGVVTTIQRQPGAVKVTASDIMVRFQKLLAVRDIDITFDNADAGVAFAAVILAAQVDGEAWSLQPPEVFTLQPYSRSVLVRDFELAWTLLSDLADAAVDFYVMDGVLYVYQVGVGWMYHDGSEQLLAGPYDANRQLVYGTFTDRSFTSLPLWTVNGQSQANTIWIPGPDIGEEGARKYWTANNPAGIVADGTLDHVETGDLFRPEEEEVPEDVFQRHADSILALRGTSPAIIEDTPLSLKAPVDVPNLRPGSLWAIDIHDSGYGQLLQTTRLKKVTVNVSKDQDGKVVETIKPTLFPPGYGET